MTELGGMEKDKGEGFQIEGSIPNLEKAIQLQAKYSVVKTIFIEIDIIREQIPKFRLERIIKDIVLEIVLISDEVKFILLFPIASNE